MRWSQVTATAATTHKEAMWCKTLTRVEREEDNQNPNSSRERERDLQIVSLSSSFQLPDGWFVEERPRPSNPSHVDRYYYEPGTGRRFRSLVSVQRYLTGETRGYLTTERMISENEDNTDTEPGTRQRFRSLRVVGRYSTGEDACTATPKSVMKSDPGKRSSCGVISCQKPVKICSSVAEEDKSTLKDSKKTYSRKKINVGKNDRGSIHNLTSPPEKVSWVLSGPGGFWSPFLDDSVVPESEKLKWSEAFVLSIRDEVINGLNS